MKPVAIRPARIDLALGIALALAFGALSAMGCVGAQLAPSTAQPLEGDPPEVLCSHAIQAVASCGAATDALGPLRSSCLAQEDHTLACALACASCEATGPLLHQLSTTKAKDLWQLIVDAATVRTATPERQGERFEPSSTVNPTGGSAQPAFGGLQAHPGSCSACQTTTVAGQQGPSPASGGSVIPTVNLPSALTNGGAISTSAPGASDALAPFVQALLNQMVVGQSGPTEDGGYRCSCAAAAPVHRDG